MTILLLRAAQRVWMSIPAWEKCWRPYCIRRSVVFEWLPIPSGIAVVKNSRAVKAIRDRSVPREDLLVGHFGTYGWPITSVLKPILIHLAGLPVRPTVLLMGAKSEEFLRSFILEYPGLSGMLQATGELVAEELSCHVSACDLLIQPYPDGVSSRRTSVMVGLSHGKAMVTTLGRLSEPLWMESEAVALAPAGDAAAFGSSVRQLQADPAERARMGEVARRLYEERFDMLHTIGALRNGVSCALSNSTLIAAE